MIVVQVIVLIQWSNSNMKMYYFIQGPNQEADKKAGAKNTTATKEFKDVFTGIGCCDCTCRLLQVKQDSRPYLLPAKCLTYTL